MSESDWGRNRLVAELYFETAGEQLQGNEMDDIDQLGWCQTAIDSGYRRMSRDHARRRLEHATSLPTQEITMILDILGFTEGEG